MKSPSDWPQRQRAFRESVGCDDPATASVHWRVIRGGALPSFAGRQSQLEHLRRLASSLAWVLARLVTRRAFNEDDVLAVWPITAAAGSVASLIFEFDGDLPGNDGSAQVLGELEPNGAFCLRFEDGSTAWPTYNPRPPSIRSPTL